MTDTQQNPPDHAEERIDPGGSAGTAHPGIGLGAPADTSGYDDVAPLGNQEDIVSAPAEGEDMPAPSPADGGD